MFEYRVIPAPASGRKAKGAKSADARYAAALSDVLNAEAAEGWEFVRAEVLPCAERQGLTGSRTVYVNVLVFRRVAAEPDPVTGEAVRLIGQAAPE